MRNHSGNDLNEDGNKDKTLRDHAGERGPGERGGDFTEGADEKVAADDDQPGGERSPAKRGRGETG